MGVVKRSNTQVLYFKGNGLLCFGLWIIRMDQAVFCLDLEYGLIVWIRLAYKGNKPKDLFCNF